MLKASWPVRATSNMEINEVKNVRGVDDSRTVS